MICSSVIKTFYSTGIIMKHCQDLLFSFHSCSTFSILGRICWICGSEKNRIFWYIRQSLIWISVTGWDWDFGHLSLRLWRSICLKKLAEKRTELEHTPYTELAISAVDVNNVIFRPHLTFAFTHFQHRWTPFEVILAFNVFHNLHFCDIAYMYQKCPGFTPIFMIL